MRREKAAIQECFRREPRTFTPARGQPSARAHIWIGGGVGQQKLTDVLFWWLLCSKCIEAESSVSIR